MDSYIEETSGTSVFKKILLIFFIIGIFVGAFIYYKKQNIIKLKTVEIEVGSKLSKNIDDYLITGKKNSSHYKLYLDDVNIDEVGEYKYKVKYNKTIKYGTIKVVDKTKPNVSVMSEVVVNNSEDFDLNLILTKCDDKSLPCNVTFKNSNDYDKLKTNGEYNLDVKISDTKGNYVVKTIKFTVTDGDSLSNLVSNDLVYYSNSENDDTIDKVLFVKLDKAINEDSLEYEKLIQETSAIDYNEYFNDIYNTKLITAYNKYGYVIGIQVLITYNNGEKELIEKLGEINEE